MAPIETDLERSLESFTDFSRCRVKTMPGHRTKTGHKRAGPVAAEKSRLDCRSWSVGPGPLNTTVTRSKAHWHKIIEASFHLHHFHLQRALTISFHSRTSR